MNFELIYNYKEDENLRRSFNKLSEKTFGINFEEWYQKDLWVDKYETYSIKAKDEIIANVSINKYKFLINGVEKNAIQISTVMTKEEYRSKGFSKGLMEFILKEFEKDIDYFYLFANDSVLDFYPRFGFKKIDQWELSTNKQIEKNDKYPLRKLNMDNLEDVSILKRIGKSRIPNSKKFDIKDSYEVLFWYCLNVFRDDIYYNEEEDFILIYKLEDEKLFIYDIILRQIKDYREIIGSISSKELKEIKFYFNLEAKNINLIKTKLEDNDDVLFIKGDFDEDVKFIHPITAHA